MPSCNPFDPMFGKWLTGLATARHRQLLLIRGSHSWCEEQAVALLSQYQGFCWLSQSSKHPAAIWPQHTHQILGQEFTHAVYDGFSGLLPDKLAALSGTVKAGGLLLLLLPEDIQNWVDPGIEKTLSYGSERPASSLFLAWLERGFGNSNMACLSQKHGLQLPEQKRSAPSTPDFAQQTQAIESIIKTASGRARRPLLISADRGRGKSAALGIAAARLQDKKIIFCSAQRNAMNTAFKHLSQQLSITPNEPNRLDHVSFYPPDKLLSEVPECDLVMVDEAASLPVPILKEIVSRYARVIFSSTLIGYEGNGRGYTLRFKRYLEQAFPNYSELNLEQPIRFANEDPLEAHINRLLALDSEVVASKVSKDEVCEEFISRQQLVEQPDLLKQVFALLVLSHYQTTVNDFRHLLDASDQSLFISRKGNCIVGACLIALEGGLDNHMAQQIISAKRRPQGHLVAQGLALESGNCDTLLLQSARIVRIAVHPELQGMGIGTRLLRFAQTSMQQSNTLAFFSTSFGAQQRLMHFWREAGFSPVKLGYKRDKVSGEHAVFYLAAAKQSLITEQESLRFMRDLPLAILHSFQDLPAEVIIELISARSNETLSAEDKTVCQRYSRGTVQFEQAFPALWRALWSTPSRLYKLTELSAKLLIYGVMQNRLRKIIQSDLKLIGKRELNTKLMMAVSEWLQETDD